MSLAIENIKARSQNEINDELVQDLVDVVRSLEKKLEQHTSSFNPTGGYVSLKTLAMLLPRKLNGKYFSTKTVQTMLMALGLLEKNFVVGYIKLSGAGKHCICEEYRDAKIVLTDLGWKYGIIKGVTLSKEEMIYNAHVQEIYWSDTVVPLLINHMKDIDKCYKILG